jgi:large subunit ribosomal protein L4
MIRLALYSALSDRAALNQIAVIDSFSWSTPKTKDALSMMSSNGLAGKILVVLGREDVVAARSFANLSNVTTLDAGELNAYDVLNADWIVFTDATLPTAKESN